MKNLRSVLIFSVLTGFVGSGMANPIHKFEDRTNAKVARLKARQNAADAASGRNKNGTTGNCGGVDIGNVTNQKGSKQGKQDVTVVITGDVVNMGNKCK